MPEIELYRSAVADGTGDRIVITVEDLGGRLAATLETTGGLIVNAADWAAFGEALAERLAEVAHTLARAEGGR